MKIGVWDQRGEVCFEIALSISFFEVMFSQSHSLTAGTKSKIFLLEKTFCSCLVFMILIQIIAVTTEHADKQKSFHGN